MYSWDWITVINKGSEGERRGVMDGKVNRGHS
jgi:hypothetical protein